MEMVWSSWSAGSGAGRWQGFVLIQMYCSEVDSQAGESDDPGEELQAEEQAAD